MGIEVVVDTMSFTFRAKTAQTACFVLGLIQLAGAAEVAFTGWEASPVDFKFFLAVFSLSLGLAIYSADHPRLRGAALAVVWFAGVQVAGWLFTTPSPPTTTTLAIGVTEGVLLLVCGVCITRWMKSVEAIADLERETVSESGPNQS